METWEYRIVTGRNTLKEADLNKLGTEGWELVGFSTHMVERHSVPAGKYSEVELICVFKRPIKR